MTHIVQPPLVSVIIAVHNETELLKLALQDLLVQTYSHIEIIIVDDASEAPTEETVRSFDDTRIQYVKIKTRSGQSNARNIALQMANGEFICIADADDRYVNTKIETQVDYLTQHPSVDVLGTWANILSSKKEWKTHTAHADIQAYLFINNPFIHSSIMFKSALMNTGWKYNGSFDTAEDYELFARNYNKWNFANIPQKLTGYLVSEKENTKQRELARNVRNGLLSQLISANDEDKRVHYLFSENLIGLQMTQIEKWINRLQECNKIISTKAFNKILQQQCWLYFKKNKYIHSSFSSKVYYLLKSRMGLLYIMKNLLKIIVNKPL